MLQIRTQAKHKKKERKKSKGKLFPQAELNKTGRVKSNLTQHNQTVHGAQGFLFFFQRNEYKIFSVRI